MYKYISLLIIPIFVTNIQAQLFGDACSEYRIARLNYENSSGEKGTTFFIYDKSNNLEKARWTLDDLSRYSNNFYEHDSNGNTISAFREFSDNLTSFEKFEYDNEGNIISETFIRSDGKAGSANYKYKKGSVIVADLKNYKGWLNGMVFYKYDTNGEKISAELNKNNKLICNITYEYDDIGNLTTEHWDFSGQWNQTFNYIYERIDANPHYYSSPFFNGITNYRISKEDYTYNGKIGGPSLYEYSIDGLLLKKTFIRSDGISTSTKYKYDNNGKLIRSDRIYSDSTKVYFTYIYDSNNNLVNRNFYKADSLFGFEYYQYNSEGTLEKAYISNFDGWLTGTIKFNSDGLGYLQSGTFKGTDGFDAEIDFDYNSDLLISNIRWDFSFGEYQEYNFEYTKNIE